MTKAREIFTHLSDTMASMLPRIKSLSPAMMGGLATGLLLLMFALRCIYVYCSKKQSANGGKSLPASAIRCDPDGVIAIDVVVLPPPSVEEKVNAVNKMLVDECKSFALDDTHKAHMTVVQTYIRERDLHAVLKEVEAVLNDLFQNIVPQRPITVQELVLGPNFDGSHVPNYAAVNDGPVHDFHMEVSRRLRKYRMWPVIPNVAESTVSSADAAIAQGCFFSLPKEGPVGGSSIAYVACFDENSSGNNYKPHFTLGAGDRATIERIQNNPAYGDKFTFPLKYVGVYQLGDFCTCRKLLLQVALGENDDEGHHRANEDADNVEGEEGKRGEDSAVVRALASSRGRAKAPSSSSQRSSSRQRTKAD